jgi:ribosomal protein S18 acetylase RimI-like enzyme
MIRPATLADLPMLVALSGALNAHESIEITPGELDRGLRELLADPRLGTVFVIEDASAAVGYALCALSFDLEFRGLEAWMTELYIVEAARGRGIGTAALRELEATLRTRGIKALHLQVRPDNPAVALYERLGFARVPRLVMTRRL